MLSKLLGNDNHARLAKRISKRFRSVDNAKRQAQNTATQSQKVVYVTRIVGTTVVTGTPPSSNTSNQRPATSQAPAVTTSSTQAAPVVTSAAPVTTQTPSPTTSSTPSSSTTPSSSSSSVTRSDPSLRIATARITSSSSSAPTTTSQSSTSRSSSAIASTSSSSSVTATVATNTAQAASSKEESSGLSTGGIVGVVAGILLGIAAILLLAGLIWKRKSRKQNTRPYSSAPYGGEKQRQRYRDSSLPITDKSGNDSDFGNANTYNSFGYPPGTRDERNRRPDTVFSQTGNFAGVGRNNFVIAEEYEEDGRFGNHEQMREIGAPGARSLTGGSAYGRYTDHSPPLDRSPELGAYAAYPTQSPYYQDGFSSNGHGAGYSEDGRHTPTDYYGQAMSHGAVAVAEEYADLPPSLDMASQSTAGKAPIQGGWQSSAGVAGAGGLAVASGLGLAHTRSLSPVEQTGRNENDVYAHDRADRYQLADPVNSTSMPQLPPLPLDNFGSPLYSGFSDPGVASRRNSAQTQEIETGANLHRKSSSAQPTALMYGSRKTEEELRKGYADLARAAEITEPARDYDLMPTPMVPERYQHGRPLSPLFEVETPEVHSMNLRDESNPFGSGSSRTSGSFRPAITVRQSSDTRPAAELRESNGIPSAKFPPPSPGVSLPESPASYAPAGPITPRGGYWATSQEGATSVQSTPEYSFKVHPPGTSAVSLDATPSTPQRHPLASSAGPSPASTNSGLPLPPPIGASRLSVASSFSDAYDGI